MMEIKQSTATRDLVFYMVDAADGFTPLTGLTPTVTLSKNGGSFGSPSGSVSEISGGFYKLAANATDSNTLGILSLKATGSGAVPVAMAYVIVANVEADTIAAIAALNNITAASVWAVGTRTLTAQSDSSGVTTLLTRIPGNLTITGGAVTVGTNNDKTGYALASAPPTVAQIADGVWDELTSGHVAAGSTGAAIIAAGSAGDPWSTTLPGAYGAGTAGNIVGNRLDAAITTRSSHNAAAVWSAATRTLTAQSDSSGVTTLLTRIPGNLTITGGAVTVGTNNDKTGYALASAPPTVAQIADGVWDELTSGHVGAGSTGAAIIAAGSAGDPWSATLPGAYGAGTAGNIVGNRIDVAISSRSSHNAAAVWSAVTRTLTAQSDSSGVTTLLTRIGGNLTITGGAVTVGTNNDKTGYALASAPPTVAQIADGVWDEPTAGHVAAGSTGAAIIAAGSSGGASAADIADAVLDELLSGHTTPGSAGAALSAASASGDPWSTPLPGSYADGTAGDAIARLLETPGEGPIIILPDPSDDANQCVMYLDTRDFDGQVIAGLKIRITPVGGPYRTAAGRMVGMEEKEILTDSDGRAVITVDRSDLVIPANRLTYQVAVPRLRLNAAVAPTTETLNLATHLLP